MITLPDHWLMTRWPQIEDGEPPKTQVGLSILPEAIVIRPTPNQKVGHALNRLAKLRHVRRVIYRENTTDAAHAGSGKSPQ